MRRIKFLKDKKITLMKYTEVQDETGAFVQNYVPLTGGENIWAYYRHSKTNELLESSKVNTKKECIFIINWRNDVDAAMKIKYKNELYEICKIDDYEGYKRNLKIHAYKVN